MSSLRMPFIFVIGAPRSGTSWLHQMLAEHKAMAGLGATELTLFSRYLSPWVTNFANEKRDNEAGKWSQGLPVLFTDEEFEQHMRGFVDAVYTKLHERTPSATHLLDKHPNYSNHLPLIDRFLPQSKFVHIIRDGREVAVSMISVRRRVGHSPGEVRGAATEWKRCITNARAYAATLGSDRYLEVRYEDLVNDTAGQLARVFAFCGIEANRTFVESVAASHNIEVRQVSGGDASLNKLRATPGAIWKEKMSIAERRMFDRIAGPLLRELGYAGTGWWALGVTDHLFMVPYAIAVRLKRSALAIKEIWTSPLEGPVSRTLPGSMKGDKPTSISKLA